MSISADTLERYLSPNETIVDVVHGRVLEEGFQTDGWLGVTDRRLLFISSADEFIHIDYGHICSMQSEPLQPLTVQSRRLRLIASLGFALAVGAFVTMVVLTSSVVGTLFAVGSVGGILAAELIRRTGIDIDWATIAALRTAAPTRRVLLGQTNDTETTKGARENTKIIHQHWDETEYVYAFQFLLVSFVSVAVAAVGGLTLYMGATTAVVLTIATLTGIAVLERTIRRMRQIGQRGDTRRNEREIRIELSTGHDVSVRFDAMSRIDRVLSQLVGDSSTSTPSGSDKIPLSH